jgi:maltose O-acetyltransferase
VSSNDLHTSDPADIPDGGPGAMLPRDSEGAYAALAGTSLAGTLGGVARTLREEFGGLHLRLRLANFLLFFCPHLSLNRLRTALYRLCGVHIGARSLVFGSITLSGRGEITRRLHIGDDCMINAPLYLNLDADITIGSHVSIGHHVVMVTAEHEIGGVGARCAALKPRSIVIEDGCWIGAGAMIAPGVTIGRGSVVSMGAVVSMDVPPNKVVGGNPARPIKTLPE